MVKKRSVGMDVKKECININGEVEID